jgi:hypothetical protein
MHAGFSKDVSGLTAGDREKPGGEVPIVAVAVEPLESAEEGLRRGVFRVFHRAKSAVKVAIDRLQIAPVKRVELAWVPFGAANQGFIFVLNRANGLFMCDVFHLRYLPEE